MSSPSSLSTNKIVILLVFLCAAIMTSVFVYHMSHKSLEPLAVEKNNSFIFTAARDIKPFDLYTAPHEKLPKTLFLHHWTLVFFGFTHCSSICPTTLDKLNLVYTKLRPSQPNLQLLFISLDPERDSFEALKNYVHTFNPDFISATGSMQELRKIQSQLGIFSIRDKSSVKKKDDYQIQHTASILLIDPQGKWAGVFNANMSVDEFTSSFQNHVKRLSQHHDYV